MSTITLTVSTCGLGVVGGLVVCMLLAHVVLQGWPQC